MEAKSVAPAQAGARKEIPDSRGVYPVLRYGAGMTTDEYLILSPWMDYVYRFRFSGGGVVSRTKTDYANGQ